MKGPQRLFTAFISIMLFILGLQLLGESTEAIAQLLEGLVTLLVTGEISALGTGWFMAYIVLNGATSAAIGIAFLEAGLIEVVNAFMVISGSRLGAAFIVIFIGLLEYLQGKNDDLKDSCSVGILQFLTTYIVYVPAIIIGYFIIDNFELSFLEVNGPEWLNYGIDAIFSPFVEFFASFLPPSLLFISSIVVVIISLQIFDKAFKGLGGEKFRSKYLRFRFGNKWIAFAFGSLVTLLTTSVALSVGIIVPMYNRGYFKRKEIIPYLMGANLTTMISSFMAAIVIGSPLAMKAVIILTATVLVTTIIALIFYDEMYRGLQKTFNTLMMHDRYMIVFVALLFLTPLLMIFLA